MLSQKRKGSVRNELISYTYPKLHSTGKNCYVDFTCFDPAEGRMRRKKIMLDSIRKKSDQKSRAAEIIANTTNLLKKGWNPWADASSSRHYAQFEEVAEGYLKYIKKLTLAKTLKPKTYYDYQSKMKTLLEYNQERGLSILYMYQFDQAFVGDFLDYILLDRDSSARTRNNYRTWLSAFSTWLMEKKYIERNPIENIKSLAEEDKFRAPLCKNDLIRLKDYLEKTNKHYLLACQMEYYTFIRPDELSNIQLKDIYLSEQKVFISSAISKNRRDGMVGLNKKLVELMVDLDIFKNPSHCYLFGRDFKPSEKKADSRIFREYFNKVRLALKFPNNYQFYSLKDSGIRDLANAEGIVIARDQARHTDISTTNKYLKGDTMPVHEETKRFEGAL